MNQKIAISWHTASIELNIRVTSPFILNDHLDTPVTFEAYLPDFGSTGGAVVLSHDATEHLQNRLVGRWYSILYENYEMYDRTRFVETLDDWGWFGPEDMKPDWYTGAPWRS